MEPSVAIYQLCFLHHCAECENIEKQPIQRMPDVISISIEGETVQTSVDSHFTRELVEKNCPKCHSRKSWKSQEIIVYPSTLIIQLNRFTFNEITKVPKKNSCSYIMSSNYLTQ